MENSSKESGIMPARPRTKADVKEQGEGTKPGTNARDSGPKSRTKFCQPNMGTKHVCIKLKFMPNVDYRLFLDMHITICFHFLIFFSNSIQIRDHVKPFRSGTSFHSIHNVKQFSIFVHINLSTPSF